LKVARLKDALPGDLSRATRFDIQLAPRKTAAALRGSVVSGKIQIKRFKDDYLSQDMRSLWQTVNAAEFHQGEETWSVDYAALAVTAPTNGTAVSANAETANDESVETILQAFREAHPEVNVESPETPNGLPLIISIGTVRLRITRTAVASGPRYHVESDDSEPKPPVQQIVSHINHGHTCTELNNVLSLILSYRNFKTQKCQKCQRLLDETLQLPIFRIASSPVSGLDTSQWKILHPACA
jgi:hypothetical protein